MKGIPNLVSIRSITRYAVALMTFEFAAGHRHLLGARPRWTSGWTTCEDQLPDGVTAGSRRW